jgi:hypothetical protein
VAGKRNIQIIRGDDYSHVVTMNTRSGNTLTPVNITGRTYTAQLRKALSQTVPDATFTCAVTNGAAGQVTITMSHTITAALDPGCYFWDLQQNAGGVLNTILSGKADVVTDATR